MNLLEDRVRNLETILAALVGSDRYRIQKLLEIAEGRNMQLGTATGTMIGTVATQKLAFLGATPIVQAAAISAPSGGATIDAQARTTISTLITTLKNIGITA